MLHLRFATKKKESGTPKGVFRNLRALRAARALRRARLSAFHHGTCGSDRTPPLSSSHATSWDSFGAPAPMVRKTERIATHDAKPTAGLPCVTRRRYPRLAVPVQRDCTRSPVMMPSGRVLPKPPESQGDEPRPAGTALAPPDRSHPAGVLVRGRDSILVPHRVTSCQCRCLTTSDITVAVMAGLVPAIHVFFARPRDVDARHEGLHLGPPKAGPECRA